MAETVPISVVETPEFLAATRKLMSDEERALLVDLSRLQPDGGRSHPWNGWRPQAAMGIGRPGASAAARG